MIRFSTEDGKLSCEARLAGYGVYLDNDSLIDLAKGPALRQQRFVDSVQRGGTLLFSLTNAAELAGPQGASASAVQAFLDSLGPHWIPLELNPWKVIAREQAGFVHQAPVSEWFMEAYFQARASELSPEGNKVLDLSAGTFFRLGTVVGWMQRVRNEIRPRAREVDQALRHHLKQLRPNYEKDKTSLDRLLPPIRFDKRLPGSLVWVHLQRLLVVQAKAFQFKRNDGLDFCHAALGTAYGNLTTLDRQWKRRVESLPAPNGLAKACYRRELDQLVDTLESLVNSKGWAGRKPRR
jgi:hypothetical protein